jgi:hypothetical protein
MAGGISGEERNGRNKGIYLEKQGGRRRISIHYSGIV